MGRAGSADLPDGESEIFFPTGLDRANHVEVAAENRLCEHVVLAAEADYSSKETRESGSAGRSTGGLSSGSSTTLSPTLLIRTSVPSKWIPSGRSTTCEWPCIKSLAMDVIRRTRSTVVATNDVYTLPPCPLIRPATPAVVSTASHAQCP